MEDLPSEWGGPCSFGGRNLCKGDIVKFFKKNKSYKSTSYFGDGSNDLCPALNLTKEDRAFARTGYALLPLLTNGQHKIQASVIAWNNGADILAVL